MKSPGVTDPVISFLYSKTTMSKNHGNANCTGLGKGHVFSYSWYPLSYSLKQIWFMSCPSDSGKKRREGKDSAIVLGRGTAHQTLKNWLQLQKELGKVAILYLVSSSLGSAK